MKILLLIPAIFLLLGGIFYFANKKETEEPKLITVNNDFIYIDLKGEIIFPGTYKVMKGTLLKEVIELAYGFTDDAITEISLNKALEKNETITIARKEVGSDMRLNLNKATFAELITIPNITEKRAISILVYKEQFGLFKSVEELLNVKNIGAATYEKIKDYFYI